jgi:manganese efflux pump family protein
MSLLELFIISIAVSMDAFAVSICKGLSMKKINIKKAGVVGLYFGITQAIMPLIGYFLGLQFKDRITSIDHWIAFVFLGFIGTRMIQDSRISNREIVVAPLNNENSDNSLYNEHADYSLNFKDMSILAIATSIDALAIGIAFAFLKVNIASAVSFIGVVTCILSMIGVKLGNVFGTIYKSKAEFAGGLILVLMGLKIFLEHAGIINF